MKIEEAIKHIKKVREATKDASICCLDGEAIDCVVDHFRDDTKKVWHKVADDGLPKKNGCYLATFERKGGGTVIDVFNFIDGYFVDWRAIEGQYTYWMEIPEIPKEK